MQKSYTKNYIKIYLWQGVSLLLNFLSMFIVVPFLASKPSIYGIYSVCISISIFLTYADLGFLSAGQKYAAEYFARGELIQEIKLIGFTCFIFVVFLLLFSVVFFFLSLHPQLLIKDLKLASEYKIASALLMTLAFFTPVTLLQRLLQIVYGIRLEEYILQRVNIIASIIKLGTVFYFFRDAHYNIVGYFLTVQIINFIAAIVILIVAEYRYNYDFKLLIRSIRFDKRIFLKTKNLAITSLFLSLTWILYYELDPLIIGKFIGSKQVAIYAIGLMMISFFRSIFGIVFSPFNARFNHYLGVNDLDGLKTFYLHVTSVLAPIIIIPILTVSLLSKPIILSWIGSDYSDSIQVAKLLVFCNLFAFITYPAGILLMAQERIKQMYIVNAIIPVVYWGGIILTYSSLGLISFALLKLIAFTFSAIFYYNVMLKFLKIRFIESIKLIIKPVLIPSLFVLIAALIVKGYLPFEKSRVNLLLIIAVAGLLISFSLIIQYFTSTRIRAYVKKIVFGKDGSIVY